jgi:hypothetical protein
MMSSWPAAPSPISLDGTRPILGDGDYRGINTITSPRRATNGRIIRDDHYRKHRRIRARVEHVIARIKDWQILRQCRRRTRRRKATTAPFSAQNGRLTRQTGS